MDKKKKELERLKKELKELEEKETIDKEIDSLRKQIKAKKSSKSNKALKSGINKTFDYLAAMAEQQEKVVKGKQKKKGKENHIFSF